MSSNRRFRAVAMIALGAIAAGCGTSTEPDPAEDFDAQAALEDFQALEAAFQSNELSVFQSLGDRTPFGGAPAGIDAMSGLEAPSAQDDGRAFVLELARRLNSARVAHREGPAMGPIISGWHRGTTFVYNPDTDEYEPDLTITGAPETGVRFVLYEVDEAGVPIVEQEVGYADLIDEGDGSAEDIVLRLLVVHMEQTILDYRTTLDHDATSGALTVRGFFAGDDVRLDFDIEVEAREVDGVENVDLAFDIRVDARDFSITGTVSGIEESDDGQGEIDITVRHREDSIRVDVSGSNGELDGTFFVNGAAFATISGPEDDPVIVNADGNPLTLEQHLVLRGIVDVVEDVFDFLEDLLDPVDELVFLGFIL